jgi:iron(III) transport system substrate-binding protein
MSTLPSALHPIAPTIRRRVGTRRGLALSLALAAAVVLAACSSSSSSSPSSSAGSDAGQSITLYNGQHEQTTDALVAAFEKKTGIQVKVRSDDEDVLANQIITEGSGSPADVIYTENSPALETLQEKGRLTAVDPSTLASVPARYNSPEGKWVGVSARVSVMVYNTGQLSKADLPTSVMELADPKWKGKIGLAQGESDFFPIVVSIQKTYGTKAAEAWLTAVKANAGGNLYPDNETLTSEVNQGHVELGVINHYYWYRERAEVGASNMHSAIATFAPRDAGYIIDVSGAGIINSSSHKAADQKFLAFLVSRQGQEILAHSDSFEYPLGSGVTTAQALQPFDTLQPAPLTIAELGDGSSATALLQQAQLE